jgi:hypothetical protein
VLKESETDQDAPQRKECFVDIWSFFKANPQTAKLMKPTVRAFNNPAKHAKAAAVFGISFGKHGANTATPQSLTMIVPPCTAWQYSQDTQISKTPFC